MKKRYKTIIKSGKVRVTKSAQTGRVAGVWHNGKFYSPKSHFKSGVKMLPTRVKLAGRKRYYYKPEPKQFRKGGKYYHKI